MVSRNLYFLFQEISFHSYLGMQQYFEWKNEELYFEAHEFEIRCLVLREKEFADLRHRFQWLQ